MKKEKTAPSWTMRSLRGSLLEGKGMFSLMELVVGMIIIGILVMAAVALLRTTEKGTVAQKKRQEALNLAKAKAEELKNYVNAQTWGNARVDLRFLPTQTPAVPSYGNYPPTTVTFGRSQFIVDPEVRYVYSLPNSFEYVPTPGTAATPETGDMIRTRVDVYYGKLSDFQPLATATVTNNMRGHVVLDNIVSNREIMVNGNSSLYGYIKNQCGSGNVSGIEVGIFTGITKVASSITDLTGQYQFSNLNAGYYTLALVSSPGYSSLGPCNFSNPISIAAGDSPSTPFNIGVSQLSVWRYYGVVGFSTPIVDIFPPGTATPTPVATVVFTPVSGAVVFSDDGNSKPITTTASGAYTILNVRSTPVAGHPYDTIQGLQASPAYSGKAYNYGTSMYTTLVAAGITMIGPITVYLNQSGTNTIPVTFAILDETLAPLPNSNYPITLSVADGSAVPPKSILSSGTTQTSLNVVPGPSVVTLDLTNNSSPRAFIGFSQSMMLDASITTPVTIVNYAVGNAAGTVCGMGSNFNYAQFRVRAVDDTGQFSYEIPVAYDGAATFGTFTFSNFRTPLGPPQNGQQGYNFSIVEGGDYTSTQESVNVSFKTNRTLNNPVRVSPLYVYGNLVVKYNNAYYADGALVSALRGQQAAPPSSGQGSGFGVSNYFSTITRGDGTGTLQVQLAAAAPTTYTVFAQINDPKTYSQITKAVTVLFQTNNTQTNPLPITLSLP